MQTRIHESKTQKAPAHFLEALSLSPTHRATTNLNNKTTRQKVTSWLQAAITEAPTYDTHLVGHQIYGHPCAIRLQSGMPMKVPLLLTMSQHPKPPRILFSRKLTIEAVIKACVIKTVHRLAVHAIISEDRKTTDNHSDPRQDACRRCSGKRLLGCTAKKKNATQEGPY